MNTFQSFRFILIPFCIFIFQKKAISQTGCDTISPLLCDISQLDGTTFTNPIYIPGTYSGDICNDGEISNPLWIPFVAGNDNLTINIIISNCELPANPPCNTLGMQFAIWDGCQQYGGNCIAGSANCLGEGAVSYNTSLSYGVQYFLLIDGCCGSTCDVELDIDFDSWDHELPDINDVTFDIHEDGRACDPPTTPLTFCVGQEVIIEANADSPSGISLDDVFGSWEWSMSNSNGVTWQTALYNGDEVGGSADDISYGGNSEAPGGNIIKLKFEEEGIYELCLNSIETLCDQPNNGNNCTTITIQNPEPQDFGEYVVCWWEMNVYGYDFIPAPYIDAAGNEWEWDMDQSEISAMDIPTGGGIIEIETGDSECCPLGQTVTINYVGQMLSTELLLQLYDCQLPYQWEGFEIDTFDLLEYALPEGSSEENSLSGINCDSIVLIIAEEIEVFDSLIIGECDPSAIEVTPDLYTNDVNNPFDLTQAEYTWIDSSSNTVAGTALTATLQPGCYYFQYGGTLKNDTTGDEFRCSGSIKYSISDSLCISVSSTDLENEIDVNLFPNPAKELININSNVDISSIELFSTTYQKILSQKHKHKKQISLNLEKQEPGIYFLNIKTEKGDIINKVIIE